MVLPIIFACLSPSKSSQLDSSHIWFPFHLLDLFVQCFVLTGAVSWFLSVTRAGSSDQLQRFWWVSWFVLLALAEHFVHTERLFFLWNSWWFSNEMLLLLHNSLAVRRQGLNSTKAPHSPVHRVLLSGHSESCLPGETKAKMCGSLHSPCSQAQSLKSKYLTS